MEKTIEIPEGYEARIEGGKVIFERKESEDERIRKWLIEMVEELRKANPTNAEHNGNCSEAIAYLERQKEQKTAEWSEEDEFMRDTVLNTLERIGDYGTIGMQKDWLKSLHPSWKPSEAQMKTLKCLPELLRNFKLDSSARMLEVLYEQLKEL